LVWLPISKRDPDQAGEFQVKQPKLPKIPKPTDAATRNFFGVFMKTVAKRKQREKAQKRPGAQRRVRQQGKRDLVC